MSPQMVKLVFNIVFYTVAAIIVVWLLVRAYRKSKAAKGLPNAMPQTPPQPAVSPALLPPPVPQAAPRDVPPPLPPEHKPAPDVLLAPGPATSQVAPAHVPGITPVSTAAARTSPLFQGVGRQPSSNPYQLPKVEAVDTPLVTGDDYVFGGATPMLAALLPESEDRKSETRKELGNAGYYEPHAQQNLAAIRYLGIIIPLIFFGLLLLIVPKSMERFVLMGLIGGPLLGWAVPRIYVKGKAADRLSQIERAMPDMLDMLNMCVSQGMTVQTALNRVSVDLKDVHPELHRELQIVNEQASIGTLSHALENFSRRVDAPEVHSFTSLLIQTERMGTSVSAALAEYSDNMRASLKQRADEKGNRAAFKLLFPTVACLMPAVFAFLLGPSILALSDFFKRDNQEMRQASQALERSNRLQGQPPRR